MRQDLLIAPDVWSPAFCLKVRGAMAQGDTGDAAILIDTAMVDTGARRVSDITPEADVIRDVEEALRAEWPRVSAFFGIGIRGSVGASFLHYTTGGFYRRHRDRDPEAAPETATRRVSVIVWLSSAAQGEDYGDFAGGALVLYPAGRPAIVVTPTSGTLVAFPSDWSHEVLTVTHGTRDAIIDWLE